jgi:hypothetical protein
LDHTWNTLNNNMNVWRLKWLTTQSRSVRLLQPKRRDAPRGESARGGIIGYGIDENIRVP